MISKKRREETYFNSKEFFNGHMARKGNNSYLLVSCPLEKFKRLMEDNKKFCFLTIDGVEQCAVKVRMKFLRSLVRIPSITNVMALLQQILKEYQIREFFPSLCVAYKNAMSKTEQRREFQNYSAIRKRTSRGDALDRSDISSLTSSKSIRSFSREYKSVL